MRERTERSDAFLCVGKDWKECSTFPPHGSKRQVTDKLERKATKGGQPVIAHRRHDDGGGHHTEDANSGDGFVVKLSLANWLGIIGLLLGQLGGAFTAYMSLQNRVVVTEQKNGEQDSTLARHETSIEKLKDRN